MTYRSRISASIKRKTVLSFTSPRRVPPRRGDAHVTHDVLRGAAITDFNREQASRIRVARPTFEHGPYLRWDQRFPNAMVGTGCSVEGTDGDVDSRRIDRAIGQESVGCPARD